MINAAAQLGPTTVPWWKDWRGECVAIVASGPSVKKAEVAKLKDRINVIAIKTSVDLCPWADVVYGCDSAWWAHRRGLPDFKGLKLSFEPPATNEFRDVHGIEISRNHDGILIDKPGHTGSGGNSGFQALNLAVQFGALGVLLIGFDMRSDGNSPHWYGRNDWLHSSNPMEDNYCRWRTAFAASVGILQELGVDVVNASNNSTMQCYRRAGVDEALKQWGL